MPGQNLKHSETHPCHQNLDESGEDAPDTVLPVSGVPDMRLAAVLKTLYQILLLCGRILYLVYLFKIKHDKFSTLPAETYLFFITNNCIWSLFRS